MSYSTFAPSTPPLTHTHTPPTLPRSQGKIPVLWWEALHAVTHTSKGTCLGFVGDILHSRLLTHKNARCSLSIRMKILSLSVGAPLTSPPHGAWSCFCCGCHISHTVHTLQTSLWTGYTILLCSHVESTSQVESLTSPFCIFMSRFYLILKIIFQHNPSITESCVFYPLIKPEASFHRPWGLPRNLSHHLNCRPSPPAFMLAAFHSVSCSACGVIFKVWPHQPRV